MTLGRPKKYEERKVDDILAYARWNAMRQRVRIHQKKYANIAICDRWINSFNNFFEDMGDCPEGYSLERKNNNLGYNKDNCKWIPYSEQNRNRCNTIWFKGMSLREATILCKVPYQTVYRRVKEQGMTPLEAITYRLFPSKLKEVLNILGE